MKIAVMGAGAVGCYYGGLLAQAGHEVCLIGRARHVEAIGRHRLLLLFYVSGLLLNIVCCLTLIPANPLDGAALSLTITKVWVAILTVGFFQWTTRPMSPGQWLLMLATAASSVALWWGVGTVAPRELAEAAGLIPLLALFWRWRPPAPFEKPTDEPPQAETTGTP